MASVLQKKFRNGLAWSNPDAATITTILMATTIFKNIDILPDILWISVLDSELEKNKSLSHYQTQRLPHYTIAHTMYTFQSMIAI